MVVSEKGLQACYALDGGWLGSLPEHFVGLGRIDGLGNLLEGVPGFRWPSYNTMEVVTFG